MANIYQNPDGSYEDEQGNPINAAAVETGPLESMLIGAGETLSNIPGMDAIFGETPAGADQAMQDLRAVNPVSTKAGAMAPGFIGPVRAGLAGQALYGAGQGAAMSPEGERGMGAGLGVIGSFIGDMGERIARRVMNTTRSVKPQGEMGQQFADTGGTLTPGQASGSEAMQQLEKSLAIKPGSSGAFSKIGKANQVNTNKLAAEALGVDPSDVTRLSDDVMAEAKALQSAEFNRIADSIGDITIPADQADEFRTLVRATPARQLAFKKVMGKDFPKEGPLELDGRTMMAMRRKINKFTTSSDTDTAELATALLEDADDIMESAAGTMLGEDYSKVRSQFRLRKQLERRGVLTPEGDVNPRSAYGWTRDWQRPTDEISQFRGNVQAASSRELNPMYGGQSPTAGLLEGSAYGNWARAPINWGLAQAYLNPSSGAGANIARGLLSDVSDPRDQY